MDYIINDYSLCGQFENTDVFLESLRINTLPVLKKVREDLDSVIWNKADLYNLEVCHGTTLSKLMPVRNIKDPILSRFKSYISLLYKEYPHWAEQEDIDILPVSYLFDNTRSDGFPMTNCFTKALQLELCMISFEHKEYLADNLSIIVEEDDDEFKRLIRNIYSPLQLGAIQLVIKKWPNIEGIYKLEVRAKEDSRHQPHFHVSVNMKQNFAESSFSFAIKDCSKIVPKNMEPSRRMRESIEKWYVDHVDELKDAWNLLNPNPFASPT